MKLLEIQTNKMELKMTKIFAFITAAVLALTLTACGDDENAPEKTAQEWVENLYEADIDDAMELINFNADKDNLEAQKNMVKGKLQGSLPEQKKMIEEQAGGVKSIVVKEVSIDKDNANKATAKVEVTTNKEYKGSLTNTETVKLEKVGSEWKVNL